MKAISELQQEVRIIRRELNSLDARLAQLDEDLQERKNAPISSNAPLYNAVYGLASHLPAIVHPLTAENSAVKKQYLALLIMSAAGSVSEDQLLLLQRIIFTDKEDNRLDSYIAAAAALSPKDIIYKIEDAIKEKLAKILLLDMLLVANLSRTKEPSAFEFIADTAAVLILPTNELRFIAEIAAAILTRKLDCSLWSDAQILEAHNNFGCYLKELPDPNGLNAEAYRKAFRIASRRIIDRFSNYDVRISWKCNSGQKVAEGDVLCTYSSRTFSSQARYGTLTAPVSGCFYHCSRNGTNYAIIASEDDNLDSIKAWIKNHNGTDYAIIASEDDSIKALSGCVYHCSHNGTNYVIIAIEDDNLDSIKAWIKNHNGNVTNYAIITSDKLCSAIIASEDDSIKAWIKNEGTR